MRNTALFRYGIGLRKAKVTVNGAGHVAIVRILGNDLHPRHDIGQARSNLEFVLNNEPEFPQSSKLFIINRIFDKDEEARIVALLQDSSAGFHVIPFVPEEYAEQPWNLSPFGGVEHFNSDQFSGLNEAERRRQQIWAAAPRVRYAMNVNGARNCGLEKGREAAEWTMLLDGNCVVTPDLYEAFRASAFKGKPTPHLVVPMRRIDDNDEFFKPQVGLKFEEEPQLAFHCTSRTFFDEAFPYGLRDKTSLLKSLGVPGEWDKWRLPPWMPNDDQSLSMKYMFRKSGGGVLRLSSGQHGLEDAGAQQQRYGFRNYAILKTIQMLDEKYGSGNRQEEEAVLGELMAQDMVGSQSADDGLPNISGDLMAGNGDIPQPALMSAEHLRGRTFFVGLGAMKAGTTWVANYLSGHPEVFHSPIKEMNFFNRSFKNSLSSFGKDFHYRRMSEILTEKGLTYPPSPNTFQRLRDLAELVRIETLDDYLSYFSSRIGSQQVFGETCPQYSLLPPEAYQFIDNLGFETKFMFFVRDPVERLASNLQHNLRRQEVDLDDQIEALTKDDLRYMRSDYLRTLKSYEESGVRSEMKVFVYEDFFKNDGVTELCDFLGIKPITPNLEKKANVSRGYRLSDQQKDRIREKLDDLYRELAPVFKDDKTTSWRW